MNYLTGERLSGSVWEGERFKIFGIDFCDLLFGNALKGNIIDCYMKIVSVYNVRNGFEIFCMDTTVQDEVLGALQRLNRKRKLNDDGYRDFLSDLTNDSRGKLEQLDRKLKDRCRYLLFPINIKYHWFLLVYVIEKREFEFRNSIYTSMSLGTARSYANFLVGYMRIMFNYRMDKKVNHVFCRQQGADLNCGIYTCLWAECYARDDDEAWNYEKVCTINSFRARISATILSDDNGLFGKDI
ncbi:uncharacterized protein [Primulina huaijiensis]|uniref:uncharacterized protein n=1 Tax=Primulina huaijiensis TaxID=1492673 RepID=UPI003CC70AE7